MYNYEIKDKDFLIETFLDYISVERNLLPRTIKEYKDDLNQFFSFLQTLYKSNFKIKDIDERIIRQFLTYLKVDKKNTASGINRRISAIKTFFKFLEKEKIIKISHATKVSSAKQRKKLPKVLTLKQVKDFLKTPLKNKNLFFKKRDYAILLLLYDTGIRVSELVNIKIKDINFTENTIKIKGKGDKERIVFFTENTKKALLEYLSILPDTKGIVFVNKNYKKISTRAVQYLFKKYLKQVNIPIDATPHTLRHSYATHMLENGADLMSIKELLGHENISTTQIYTNIALKHIKNIYNKTHPKI